MKTKSQFIVIAIATITLALAPGCATDRAARKAPAQPQVQQAPAQHTTESDVTQNGIAHSAKFEKIEKDSSGNTNAVPLTSHFVTEPFKKRDLQFSQAAIQPFLNYLGSLQLSANSVVNVMETRKNLAVVAKDVYGVGEADLEKLIETHAPLLSKNPPPAGTAPGSLPTASNSQGIQVRYDAVNDVRQPQQPSGTMVYGTVPGQPYVPQGQPSMVYGTVPGYYQQQGGGRRTFVYGRQ